MKGHGVSFPPDREARRAYQEAQATPYVPHPIPEVPARDAQPHEIPIGAKRIIKVALANGWELRVKPQYARGHSLTARGTAGKVVDNVTVACIRGRAHLIATWVDGAFDFAYVRNPGEAARKASSRELRAFIEQDTTIPDALATETAA